MLTMILERIERMEDKQDELLTQISSINVHGCAHRTSDMVRITELEKWRDKGIIGIIVTLISSIGALLGMLFSHSGGK